MKMNRETLIKLREAKGLTQEQVAAMSKLDVRTVQRAEAGTAIGLETLAQIAATLGVPNDELLVNKESEAEATPNVDFCVLHAVQAPLHVISLLSSHQDADLECIAETTGKGRADGVLAFLDAIEKHLPTLTPDVHEPLPTVADRVRRKVALEQKLSAAMQSMKAAGLGLYAGTFTDVIRIPHYDDEMGFWAVSLRSRPQPVSILVLRVAEAGQQRLVISKSRSKEDQ